MCVYVVRKTFPKNYMRRTAWVGDIFIICDPPASNKAFYQSNTRRHISIDTSISQGQHEIEMNFMQQNRYLNLILVLALKQQTGLLG